MQLRRITVHILNHLHPLPIHLHRSFEISYFPVELCNASFLDFGRVKDDLTTGVERGGTILYHLGCNYLVERITIFLRGVLEDVGEVNCCRLVEHHGDAIPARDALVDFPVLETLVGMRCCLWHWDGVNEAAETEGGEWVVLLSFWAFIVSGRPRKVEEGRDATNAVVGCARSRRCGVCEGGDSAEYRWPVARVFAKGIGGHD